MITATHTDNYSNLLLPCGDRNDCWWRADLLNQWFPKCLARDPKSPRPGPKLVKRLFFRKHFVGKENGIFIRVMTHKNWSVNHCLGNSVLKLLYGEFLSKVI